MKLCIVSVLLLISAVEGSDRFFISAPKVFHLGVKEKVFVQMEDSYLNQEVTLYLQDGNSGTLMSAEETTRFTQKGEIKIVELMINRELWLKKMKEKWNEKPYLDLKATVSNAQNKQVTRVLVSNHRGYIFIQTDQPMYNPTQKVQFRIFTLDHMFRPQEEMVQISIFNAAENRILQLSRTAVGGIYRDHFQIPSLSKMGTWKITAHYEEDELNAAVREFKVQKFVLPSFDVNIEMEQRYILLDDERLNFTISAMYSHGEKVRGAYHCQFGVVKKDATYGQKTPEFIRGMELTGSVQNGTADFTLQLEDIHSKLKEQLNQTFFDLLKSGSQLYVGVFVTNIQSGEIQEGEVFLPIIFQRYSIDLSRIRSHFIPGFPLYVPMVMQLPDRTPAAGVPINITVTAGATQKHWQAITDQDGAVSPVFEPPNAPKITVEASADGIQKRKIVQRASSTSNSYLYMTITNKVYSVNDFLQLTFNTVNGPLNQHIYYMVLSRGIIIKTGSLRIGASVKHNLKITADMVPSFRLIAYYHGTNNKIIADSVWVDVRDECEIKVKVEHKGEPKPGQTSVLEVDLHGQSAKVALLAVDKAFYALKANNKLTDRQVFSTMESYDLGCTFGGEDNSSLVFVDAGLSFVSQSGPHHRKDFRCNSETGQPKRSRRSVELKQEMITLVSELKLKPDMQDCCTHAFSPLPMRRTCQERATRVQLIKANQTCADVFLKCCKAAEKLRQKQMQEDVQGGLGRTATSADIEKFFQDYSKQYIRRYFPPSFAFTEFDVNGKQLYPLALPDSITKWEIQVVTISPTTGFCVVKPHEVKAFQETFVSLRLPYSVKKYEQLSVSPVIYNYGKEPLQLAVHMEQTEGLCSPASATKASYVTIDVEPQSSHFVSFSAVPMVTGPIPIKIRLYDIENNQGIDAVEKSLNVQTEGLEERVEETTVVKLDGQSSKILYIDGTLPDETVPESSSNVFISIEGDGFGSSQARNLLSPEKVASLIALPKGCLEQTMKRLVPTALALRYLDLTDQWLELLPGARDEALANIERGYMRIFEMKRKNYGVYGTFSSVPSSTWVTAYVLKVLSLISERQTVAAELQGRSIKAVPTEEIIQSVTYLHNKQQKDGSFKDQNPVLHRDLWKEQETWLTAFITLALNRSIQFLPSTEQTKVKARILRATTYLQSQLTQQSHTYVMALTAYCLSVCLPQEADRLSAWKNLQSRAIKDENQCYLWTEDPNPENENDVDAITIETTAYALLTAVEVADYEWADQIACWLASKENYFGGYRSTQDTVMALEALSEYELKRPRPDGKIKAELTVPGKTEIVTLALQNRKEKVEADLKKLAGNNITVQLTGKGDFKLKTIKAFYLLDPEDDCTQLSISVTVEGKVKYRVEIVENYDYYNYYDDTEEKKGQEAPSVTEHSDTLTSGKRLENNINTDNTVTYTVCVSLNPNTNLSGMAIADITLLSGFEAKTEDLDRLKQPPEQYITHYELSFGRVLIYFNELFEQQECFSFDVVQSVPIGLLQPAPAVFYDYYEPRRKCTVFYSAPKRSKMISTLCSEDVCQCAERPCQKMQNTFKSQKGERVTKTMRTEHACFDPKVDYAYIAEVQSVSVKSNFELYKANITEVLKFYGDHQVNTNSVRVFARRLQCKGELELEKTYLIMGKDGSTKDSDGEMQYLLESNTWVEKRPLKDDCKKSAHRQGCIEFNAFIEEFKTDGCRQ
ncbi:complement C4-like [Kryptolebias marmoratus]|uniref:complement C4-like n=1 Tax=Kryptolebias marmoratus TaxID=37003 RepID=UPI0007F937D0|nr:complement C4-like [Kryptolebias marmoratus]